MTKVNKNDVNQIFGVNAPDQDKPPYFNNYTTGWGESRSNNGKPTIKGFNFLQQRTDQNLLWIHQNGGALPYDESIDYVDGSIVLKDGILYQLKNGSLAKYGENKNIVTTVNTIDELLEQETWEGKTVYHKGYYDATNFALATPYKGGGIRIYAPSRASENDGFLCINGWVLQLDEPNVLNPLQAGAYADGKSDDQDAIKKCITTAKASGVKCRIAIDANYSVGSITNSDQFMFELNSNIELSGCGSISCLSGSSYPSTAFAIVGYAQDARIHDVTIRDFMLDLNKDNVTSASTAESSISAINLNNCTDPRIINMQVRNTPGGGIYVRQALDETQGALRGLVTGNTVTNTGYIGIQCRRPYNTNISNNIVMNCGDNCIDVEGVKLNDIWNGYVQNLVISANNCQSGNNGLFLESIGKATVTGNHITGCQHQITLNHYSDATQAYSMAKDILITGNTLDGDNVADSVGILSQYCGFWSCYGNNFRNLKTSFRFDQNSGVSIGRNYHVLSQISKYIFDIPKPIVNNASLVWSHIDKQDVILEHFDQDMPNFMYATALTNPVKSGLSPASYLSIIDGIINMKRAKLYDITNDEQYKYFTGKVLSNGISDWGGAYSIYFNNETRIALNLSIPSESSQTVAGACFLINGNYYQVVSSNLNSGSLFEVAIRKFNSTSGKFESGNFSSELNSALTATGFINGWFL